MTSTNHRKNTMTYRTLPEAEKKTELDRVRSGGSPASVRCTDCGMTMRLISKSLRIDSDGYTYCAECCTGGGTDGI